METKMITTEEQEGQNKEEGINTELGRFQQLKKNGYEVEAFLLRAQLQQQGIWVD